MEEMDSSLTSHLQTEELDGVPDEQESTKGEIVVGTNGGETREKAVDGKEML